MMRLNVTDAERPVSASVTYFEVYSANVGRLGLLEHLAPDVVTLYTRMKAFLEGMRIVKEVYRDLIEGRIDSVGPIYLATRYRGAADLLATCVNQGEILARLLRPPDFEGLKVDAQPTRGRLGVAILAVGMIGVPEHCDTGE